MKNQENTPEKTPNDPKKVDPFKKDKDNDPTRPQPGVNEPSKTDPTRIAPGKNEPGKTDPTRIQTTPGTA